MTRISPYAAMLFCTRTRMINKTAEMKENIRRTVDELIRVMGKPDFPRAFGRMDLPIKLIALPEAFSTGWPDSFLDLDHDDLKRVYDTTVPGDETDMLGVAARETGTYIMACMQARDPDIKEDRFFNIAFIVNPEGKVIYKRHKSSMFFRERLTCPTDIWECYLEKYGTDAKSLLDALFPVVRTDIGNLAAAICGEGDKPELFRAFAINGAEVIYRATYPVNEHFELQNRAHAHFNNCYLLGVNGPEGGGPPPSGSDAGQALFKMERLGHIIDYRGDVLVRSSSTMAWATIDVEQLRYYRFNSLFENWLPQLRMEQYILPYLYALDIGGLYPKNLAMDDPPLTQRLHDDVIRYCINRLAKLGIWSPPDGWKPFKIPQTIIDRIEKAGSRSRTGVSSGRKVAGNGRVKR